MNRRAIRAIELAAISNTPTRRTPVDDVCVVWCQSRLAMLRESEAYFEA